MLCIRENSDGSVTEFGVFQVFLTEDGTLKGNLVKKNEDISFHLEDGQEVAVIDANAEFIFVGTLVQPTFLKAKLHVQDGVYGKGKGKITYKKTGASDGTVNRTGTCKATVAAAPPEIQAGTLMICYVVKDEELTFLEEFPLEESTYGKLKGHVKLGQLSVDLSKGDEVVIADPDFNVILSGNLRPGSLKKPLKQLYQKLHEYSNSSY